MLHRLIPCLLLKGGGLCKTVRFKAPQYVGDPINAVRIFNDKEVDELILLDIDCTKSSTTIPFQLVEEIASEAFMPLCYGGGVQALEDFERLFSSGIEKVAVNTAAVENPSLVARAAAAFGSQSVVVAIDVRTSRLKGRRAHIRSGTVDTGLEPLTLAQQALSAGAGEILLTSIDREGTGNGYDIPLVAELAGAIDAPLMALGGAANLTHCQEAVQAGAAAAAAGSMFVFHGSRRAVLINYPSREERGRLG